MAEVLDGILRAVTRHVSQYIRTHRKDKKFFVLINMATGEGEAFGSRKDAVTARAKVRGGEILGPLSAIMDVSGNDGWPDHPTSEFHIVNKDLTIVGEKNKKKTLMKFPNSDYNTYVVVVKKKAR